MVSYIFIYWVQEMDIIKNPKTLDGKDLLHKHDSHIDERASLVKSYNGSVLAGESGEDDPVWDLPKLPAALAKEPGDDECMWDLPPPTKSASTCPPPPGLAPDQSPYTPLLPQPVVVKVEPWSELDHQHPSVQSVTRLG